MSDQFFKTYEETKVWLDNMSIMRYTIRDDLTVDVDSNVIISTNGLKVIPVQFGVVNGNFWCDNNHLTSLAGAPKQCREFFCYDNRLTNLDGAPQQCFRFDCSGNQLTLLDRVPSGCQMVNCNGNPDLYDISGLPDTCDIRCDYDIIAKNQAKRHLMALDVIESEGADASHSKKSGRVL